MIDDDQISTLCYFRVYMQGKWPCMYGKCACRVEVLPLLQLTLIHSLITRRFSPFITNCWSREKEKQNWRWRKDSPQRRMFVLLKKRRNKWSLLVVVVEKGILCMKWYWFDIWKMTIRLTICLQFLLQHANEERKWMSSIEERRKRYRENQCTLCPAESLQLIIISRSSSCAQFWSFTRDHGPLIINSLPNVNHTVRLFSYLPLAFHSFTFTCVPRVRVCVCLFCSVYVFWTLHQLIDLLRVWQPLRRAHHRRLNSLSFIFFSVLLLLLLLLDTVFGHK